MGEGESDNLQEWFFAIQPQVFTYRAQSSMSGRTLKEYLRLCFVER